MASSLKNDRLEPRQGPNDRAGVLPSAAWTPGPWFVEYEAVGDEGDGVTEFPRVTGYEPTGDLLDASGRVVSRNAANEELKAAAPDLYDAVRGLMLALRDEKTPAGVRLVAAAIEARAALAKAGRRP